MKIGAYQFAVSVDMKKNLEVIKAAVRSAEDQGIEFLLFPECALTGYPPRDLPSSSDADFSFVESLGLRENLSPTRANGLASMIATIRETALRQL